MKIIAFAGMPFSGKSVAVDFARQQNIPVVRMGDLVWEETRRQGRPLDDRNVGDVANSMRKKYGMDIWAQKTVECMKTLPSSNIYVIDGIRNKEEIIYFKKHLGSDFLLIAIIASDEIRHQRGLMRGRRDDSGTLKAMLERDKREIGWGLPEVLRSADIRIENNSSLEEFQEQIKKFFQSILEKR
ncbi:MAG: AAA family ATPase [Candidatus Thermoplasmatota archaeon]